MKEEFIPLISKKGIRGYSAEEYRAKIKAMYVSPKAGKLPAKPVTMYFTKKGNPAIRVNRTPKWISPEEIADLALTHEVTSDKVRFWIEARRIPISADGKGI